VQTTTNYGLQKPEPNDTYNKATDDSNMDSVDLVLFSLGQAVQQMFGTTTLLLSGGKATKDATTANQVDVTAADVYFASGQHKDFPASTAAQYTTSAVSSTYYLDYNPDGTTTWGTAHSVQSGYATICTVASDASGNIATITDTRPLITVLLGGKGVLTQSQIGAANGVAGLDANKQVPANALGNVPPVNAATTTALGTVEVADAPAAGSNPVTITTDNAAYKAVHGGTFVTAGAGIAVTAAANAETVAVTPATAAALGGVKVGSGVNVAGDGTISVPVTSAASGTSLGTVELPPSAGTPATPVALYRAASVQEDKLTTTAATNVVTFTPAANGNFIVTASVRIITAATTVTLTINWTDAAGVQQDVRMNAQSLAVGTHDVPIKFLNSVSGQAITVTATAGTANQALVSAAILGV